MCPALSTMELISESFRLLSYHCEDWVVKTFKLSFSLNFIGACRSKLLPVSEVIHSATITLHIISSSYDTVLLSIPLSST